jgi:hypothetical protein
MLDNVMIDIETLGTKPGSAILSIGAVMFGSSGLGDTFYQPVSLQSCTNLGLKIDAHTVAWWMKQSDEARHAAFRDNALSLPVILMRFSEWFVAQNARYPWCHGATFDVPILEAAYEACGMLAPWKFYDVRDTRTLYDLAGVKPDRSQGTHHNALDDARAQAEAAVRSLQLVAPVAQSKSERAKWTTNQWYEHVGAWETSEGFISFGSVMALGAMLIQFQRAHAAQAQTQAARDVLAERRRQVDKEGFTSDQDDSYQAAELPRAAAAYILSGGADDVPAIWPWHKKWWKPRDGRSNYVRAAALLLAEIERIDRANAFASAEKP